MKVPINIAQCILIDGNREYHDRCPNQSKQFKSGHYTYPVKSDQTLFGFDPRRRQIDFCWKKGLDEILPSSFLRFQRKTNQLGWLKLARI